MALSITRVPDADFTDGNKRHRVRDIAFDDSYPTGGEPLAPEDVGLKVITEVIPHGPFLGSGDAIVVAYDYSAGKLVALIGAEQTGLAVDTGTDTVDVPAAPLAEVAATTDLDAYSGRVTFIGW